MDEIEEFKRKILLYYHARPTYVIKRVLEATRNYKVFANYTKYGFRLLKNNLIKRKYDENLDKHMPFDKNKAA